LTDCMGCHGQSPKKPANHYNAQCSLCHSPGVAWLPVKQFDHATAGVTDCLACHASLQLANHYNKQCSICHEPTGWKPVAHMDHSVLDKDANCRGCHEKMSPTDHFPVLTMSLPRPPTASPAMQRRRRPTITRPSVPTATPLEQPGCFIR
jgi:hypothetical protein